MRNTDVRRGRRSSRAEGIEVGGIIDDHASILALVVDGLEFAHG